MWVYDPGGDKAGAAWRLGDPDGRCFATLCWDGGAGHVQPGCASTSFVELDARTAPWLRSSVGAPKAKGSAAKRAYADAVARGPYAETERVEEQQVPAARQLQAAAAVH